MRVRVLIALAACVAALHAIGPAAMAARSVPRGFLGMIADGPLFDPAVDLAHEVAVMRKSGVGSVRFSIYWDTAQPVSEAATDLSGVDRLIAETARRRLRVLPVVLRAPLWARLHPDLQNSPPSAAGREAYGRFLALLVARYGPRGTFWTEHPELPRMPVRSWQIWNEPAGERDWSDQPGIPAYVQLLKPAYRAVKAADPGAQVVLAGLVGRSWNQLDEIYRRGGKPFFDAAAVHPFSRPVSNVMLILRYMRDVMRLHHDARTPLVVTELSWPSAKGKTSVRYGFETTERGQATKLRTALRQIAAKRRAWRIPAVFWSSWLSYDRDPTYSFDYAGVRRLEGTRVVAKPAFFAFRSLARRLTR